MENRKSVTPDVRKSAPAKSLIPGKPGFVPNKRLEAWQMWQKKQELLVAKERAFVGVKRVVNVDRKQSHGNEINKSERPRSSVAPTPPMYPEKKEEGNSRACVIVVLVVLIALVILAVGTTLAVLYFLGKGPFAGSTTTTSSKMIATGMTTPLGEPTLSEAGQDTTVGEITVQPNTTTSSWTTTTLEPTTTTVSTTTTKPTTTSTSTPTTSTSPPTSTSMPTSTTTFTSTSTSMSTSTSSSTSTSTSTSNSSSVMISKKRRKRYAVNEMVL